MRRRLRSEFRKCVSTVKTYFVRKAAGWEIVGLFVAASIVELAGLVDECCDPTLCEYAPAPSGGLMVSDVTTSKWPRPAGETATGLEEAIFSQQWEDNLDLATSARKWKPLAPAARRLLKALAGKPETVRPSGSLTATDVSESSSLPAAISREDG